MSAISPSLPKIMNIFATDESYGESMVQLFDPDFPAFDRASWNGQNYAAKQVLRQLKDDPAIWKVCEKCMQYAPIPSDVCATSRAELASLRKGLKRVALNEGIELDNACSKNAKAISNMFQRVQDAADMNLVHFFSPDSRWLYQRTGGQTPAAYIFLRDRMREIVQVPHAVSYQAKKIREFLAEEATITHCKQVDYIRQEHVIFDDDDIQLKSVPKEISVFENLQELHLSGNAIKSLPSELFDLAQLRLVDLQINKIREVPLQWFQYMNQQRARVGQEIDWDLTKNPITYLPSLHAIKEKDIHLSLPYSPYLEGLYQDLDGVNKGQSAENFSNLNVSFGCCLPVDLSPKVHAQVYRATYEVLQRSLSRERFDFQDPNLGETVYSQSLFYPRIAESVLAFIYRNKAYFALYEVAKAAGIDTSDPEYGKKIYNYASKYDANLLPPLSDELMDRALRRANKRCEAMTPDEVAKEIDEHFDAFLDEYEEIPTFFAVYGDQLTLRRKFLNDANSIHHPRRIARLFREAVN